MQHPLSAKEMSEVGSPPMAPPSPVHTESPAVQARPANHLMLSNLTQWVPSRARWQHTVPHGTVLYSLHSQGYLAQLELTCLKIYKITLYVHCWGATL